MIKCLGSADPRRWEEIECRSIVNHVRATTSEHIKHYKIVPYGHDKIIKTQPGSLIHEVMAMELVRKRTNIPVPEVFMTFASDDGMMYTVMSRIHGEPLEKEMWRMSRDEISSVIGQLTSHVQQLRSLGKRIGCPKDVVAGAWPIGPFSNAHFGELAPSQIFYTPDEFARYWMERTHFRAIQNIPTTDLKQKFPTQLSHGDLSFKNVIVLGSSVVGIIDWDTFGWYPQFWEPMIATSMVPSQEVAEICQAMMNGKNATTDAFIQVMHGVFNTF